MTSNWEALVTFSDRPIETDGVPPMVFLDDHHHPRVDDPRGGEFAVDRFAPHVLPILGELPGLRFAMVDGNTGHVVAQVLDGFQVARLAGALREWLDARVGPFDLEPVPAVTAGEAR